MTPRDGKAAHDLTYVSQQYKDSSRLDARLRLYKLYGQPQEPSFHQWMFEHMTIPANARVLELGCGTGILWLENAEKVPPTAEIILSDNSPAMLDVVRDKIQGVQYRYELIDARSIPLEPGSVDIVIANHLLYHIQEREKVLQDIRRVLRPGGHFFCSTNDWTHIIELRSLLERFCPQAHVLPARYLPDAFDGENGAHEIERVFQLQAIHTRRSHLKVTDASDLIAYVRSTIETGSSADLNELRTHVEWFIRLHGYFYITLCVVLFDAI